MDLSCQLLNSNQLEVSEVSFSLVIASNSHNPTVVTDHFLLKSGIIDDVNRIDRDRLIITPALTQILIDKTVLVNVEPDKLNIQSSDFESPFKIGQLYCANLIHIIPIAIGYNFHSVISDFDIINWVMGSFQESIYKFGAISGVDIAYPFENVYCTVNIRVIEKNKVLVISNFHRDIIGITLGDIKENFLSKAEIFLELHRKFIKETFFLNDYEQQPNN